MKRTSDVSSVKLALLSHKLIFPYDEVGRASGMRKIKVVAVGAGMWGRNIVRALKELEGEGIIEITAVIDSDGARARSVAEEFRVPSHYTDVEVLAHMDVDAATVAVPIDKLVDVAEALVDNGLNVFVEKPVSMDPDRIKELEVKAKNAGRVVQPGFIVRYDPASKGLMNELNKGGRPRYMVFKRLSKRPEHRRNFPIVFDLMIHDIDLANFFLGDGEFEVLSVLTSDFIGNVPQTVTAHMVLGKTHIQLVSDGLLPVKVREAEVITETSYLKASFTERTVEAISPEMKRKYRVEGEEPLKAELKDFFNRVKGREVQEAPKLEDAWRACRIARQIMELSTR